MKHLAIIALALLGSCASVSDAPFRAVYVNHAPSADLQQDDADEFTSQSFEVGLMYGGNGETTPERATGLVSDFALSAFRSEGDVTTVIIPGVTSVTNHIDIDLIGLRTGLRYYFNGVPSKFLQPYIGGGLLAQHGFFDAGGGDDDNVTALGFSGIVGVDSYIGNHVRLGVGYQITHGMDFDTAGVEVDMDSRALVFSLGVGF